MRRVRVRVGVAAVSLPGCSRCGGQMLLQSLGGRVGPAGERIGTGGWDEWSCIQCGEQACVRSPLGRLGDAEGRALALREAARRAPGRPPKPARHPEARALWARGLSALEIAAALSCSSATAARLEAAFEDEAEAQAEAAQCAS